MQKCWKIFRQPIGMRNARRGLPRSAIVIDPGIGFGKRAEESLSVLRNLEGFVSIRMCLACRYVPQVVYPEDRPVESGCPYDPLWGTAATVASGRDSGRSHRAGP